MANEIGTQIPVGTILLDLDNDLIKEYRHIKITTGPVQSGNNGERFVRVISIFVSNRGSLSMDNMGSIDLNQGKWRILWSLDEANPHVEGLDVGLDVDGIPQLPPQVYSILDPSAEEKERG